MGFSRMLQWMVLALMPIYLVTGCGDLEPEMQDTRTVILKMDFDQRSSSRTSSVSPAELSNYKTHLVMAQPSSEHFSSSYLYPKSLAEGLMDPVSRKITLKLKLNTQMKIFAFLFREKYIHYDLFSAKRDVGYYGQSQPFSIGSQTDSLRLNIRLTQVSGTDTTVTTDTTAPVLTEVYPVTTPTSSSTPDYTFHSSEAGTISYGGTCSSTTITATIGNNTIHFNTLADGTYPDCTIIVKDYDGNISNTLPVTPFTVNTTVTNVTIDTTLLAHYAFEGNLNDNSSYNRHLTEVGSNITYSAADNQSNKSGQAALFNGTDTYAYTDNISISSTDNFTIAFWVRPDSPNMSQWDSVMSTGDSTSGGRFQIDYSGNHNIRFVVSGATLSMALDNNTWNHFVYTKTYTSTSNKLQFYKNGSSQGSSAPVVTRWDKLKIGLNRNGGGYWKGYIDELKIYNRTFSTQEVLDLYESY